MSLRIVCLSNRRGVAALGVGAGGVVDDRFRACRDRGRVRRRTAVRQSTCTGVAGGHRRGGPAGVLRLTGATALSTSVSAGAQTYSTPYERFRARSAAAAAAAVAVPGTSPAAAVPADARRWYWFTLLNPRPVEPASRTDQDQVCLLAWTEGVGGTPACVQHTHRSPLAGLTPSQPAQTARRDRVHLNTLRPGCAAGPAGLLQAMVRGRPTVFMERLQAGRAAPGAPPRGDVGGGDGLPPRRAAQRGRTHRLGHRPSHRLPRARRDPTARGRRAGRPGGGGRAAGTHPCLTRPGRARTRACRAPRRPGRPPGRRSSIVSRMCRNRAWSSGPANPSARTA